MLQVCKAGRQQWVLELMPQILPLFGYQPGQQVHSSGSSDALLSLNDNPNAPGQHARDESYWDLVYILYSEVVDTIGCSTARQLIAGWKPIEDSLQVCPLSCHAMFLSCIDDHFRFYEKS